MKIANLEFSLQSLLALVGHSDFVYVEEKGDISWSSWVRYQEGLTPMTYICQAPYLEQIAEWLRETHKLHIEIRYEPSRNEDLPWKFYLHEIGTEQLFVWEGHFSYKTYETALGKAVNHALNIIEERTNEIPKKQKGGRESLGNVPAGTDRPSAENNGQPRERHHGGLCGG